MASSMDSSFGKFFYLSSFAVGSFIAKALFDQYGTLPLHLFYSSIEVHSYDEAYNYLMYWLTKQRFNEKKRHLIASTSLTSGQPDWYNEKANEEGGVDDFDPDDTIDDAKWRASFANTRPLLWMPSTGTHWFKFMGRHLALTREVEEHNAMMYTRTEKLRISCLGWDASALKQLMLEARVEFSQKEKGKTVIYRGSKRAYDNEFTWIRSISRPARPLSTVLLEGGEKHAFLQDVQQYLHPATMRWYSDRGIPYRRGYLFYGPPGTGKSSLAFAAAGFLGLNVYILNLNSQQLTEDALAQLFQDLPRRCLVLLEDIDSNEVTNRRTAETSKKRKGKSSISLSALLNIIDGVAAQEGRALIMTTNHHEHLDPALVRPGRVDYQLEFKLASRHLAREMFQNIFNEPQTNIDMDYEDSRIEIVAATESKEFIVWDSSSSSATDIEDLAIAFSEKIPEHTFSPAEIQGFLLRHKSSPEDAVANVEAWVRKTLDEKEQQGLEDVHESEEVDTKTDEDQAEPHSDENESDQESSEDEETDQIKKIIQ
ncbi:BCS1 and AAA domain-containing protein [Aspergillus affinis]|uniref:BCS1 and AAA domain-containing protein n=1 Tax=Aspergillus affinis TaxID=1070780 RepID=UPI0022FE0067|nr:uncharacterized protein KD926_007198 [Aspergillus affinis]KAI9041244.1 hypothetical protein KD926_007198 [Aspergillus affinis]